ncbi:MAG: tyrosine-type recombinase/integrase [Betaproteobacteria bacterium]
MADIRKRVSWEVSVAGNGALSRSFACEDAARRYVETLQRKGHCDAAARPAREGRWQVRVRRVGCPTLTRTFRLRRDAEEWAAIQESSIARRDFIDFRSADRTTLGELMQRYRSVLERNGKQGTPDWTRCGSLQRHAMCGQKLSVLQPSHFARYRDERLGSVKGTTVTKELELFSRVIALARREWGIHLPNNPASGQLVRRPPPQPGDARNRRLKHETRAQPVAPEEGLPTGGDEQRALLRACRYPHWFTSRADRAIDRGVAGTEPPLPASPVKARVRDRLRLWALVSLAIETALRRGELLKLLWTHVRLSEGYLELPGSITKNRKPRIVPLTLRALRILATQPRTGERVFNEVGIEAMKSAFRRARARIDAADLRFHDLRHEAASRLFELTTLRAEDIGHVTGHTDPRMLARYVHHRPLTFVKRFRESFIAKSKAVGEPAQRSLGEQAMVGD